MRGPENHRLWLDPLKTVSSTIVWPTFTRRSNWPTIWAGDARSLWSRWISKGICHHRILRRTKAAGKRRIGNRRSMSEKSTLRRAPKSSLKSMDSWAKLRFRVPEFGPRWRRIAPQELCLTFETLKRPIAQLKHQRRANKHIVTRLSEFEVKLSKVEKRRNSLAPRVCISSRIFTDIDTTNWDDDSLIEANVNEAPGYCGCLKAVEILRQSSSIITNDENRSTVRRCRICTRDSGLWINRTS